MSHLVKKQSDPVSKTRISICNLLTAVEMMHLKNRIITTEPAEFRLLYIVVLSKKRHNIQKAINFRMSSTPTVLTTVRNARKRLLPVAFTFAIVKTVPLPYTLGKG